MCFFTSFVHAITSKAHCGPREKIRWHLGAKIRSNLVSCASSGFTRAGLKLGALDRRAWGEVASGTSQHLRGSGTDRCANTDIQAGGGGPAQRCCPRHCGLEPGPHTRACGELRPRPRPQPRPLRSVQVSARSRG